MRDEDKSKEQLISELSGLRLEIADYQAQHKELEEVKLALTRSERSYRDLFECGVDPLAVFDAETLKIILCNKQAASLYGFDSPEETIGINPLDYIHPEDKERTIKHIADHLFQKDLRESNIFRTVTKNGEEKWISAVGIVIDYHGRKAALASFRDITRGKRTEDALRESEEKLRITFESIDDGIVIIDPQGFVLEVNEAAVRMAGFGSKGEVIGMNAFDIISPRDRDRVMNDFLGRQEGRFHQRMEYAIKTMQGQEFVAEITASSLYDASGCLLGYIAVLRDITERKRADKKLRESEEKYKELVEREKDVIFSVDESGHFTSINSAVMSWGFKTEGVIGRHFSEFILPEWQNMVPVELDKLLTSDEITAEMVVSDAWGKEHPVEFSATVIRDGTEYRGVRGIVRDITERKRIEEALRESEQKLRLTFESINEAIILTDVEGNILDINEAGLRMSGYDMKSQVIGLNGIQFFQEDERPKALETLAKLLKEGRIPIINHKIVSKTGKVYDSEVSAVLLRDNTGNTTGIIEVVRDISERMRMEEALRDSEEKLRFMFSSIIDAVVVVDLEGKVQEVNDAGLKLTGYSAKDELIGVNSLDFVIDEDRERALNDMLDSFVKGPAFWFSTGSGTSRAICCS
jgi:PAS domain S-box-containing protein